MPDMIATPEILGILRISYVTLLKYLAKGYLSQKDTRKPECWYRDEAVRLRQLMDECPYGFRKGALSRKSGEWQSLQLRIQDLKKANARARASD